MEHFQKKPLILPKETWRLDRQHGLQPSHVRWPSALKVKSSQFIWTHTRFMNTAGLQALCIFARECVCVSVCMCSCVCVCVCVCFCACVLIPLGVLGVGSWRHASVISALAGVALAGGSRGPGLPVGAGVPWLSLGAHLSRASVFTVAGQTGWAWERGGVSKR